MSGFINIPDFKIDILFNAVCSIWKKGGTGVVSSYGIESQSFIKLAENIPCCAQPGDGKELDTAVAFGIQNYLFFMKPVMVDNPPVSLNIHHWLQINGVTGPLGAVVNSLIVDEPDPTGTMFDILNVKDPMLFGHHLEIQAKLTEP